MWSLFHHSPSSKWLVTLIWKPVHIELDVMHPERELQHVAVWLHSHFVPSLKIDEQILVFPIPMDYSHFSYEHMATTVDKWHLLTFPMALGLSIGNNYGLFSLLQCVHSLNVAIAVDIHHWQSQPQQHPAKPRIAVPSLTAGRRLCWTQWRARPLQRTPELVITFQRYT